MLQTAREAREAMEHFGLVSFAYVLESAGAFQSEREVIYFFEKPWQWTSEWEMWNGLARPGEGEASWETFVDAIAGATQ